jgi:type IV pilus biogenesis protein CpaD/CtpE
MRTPARSLVLTAIAVAALGGCATAGPPPGPSCEAAFEHADGLLREGFATYVVQIQRYATARDPGFSTAGAEERARVRADAWTAQHRPTFVAECRAWPEDRVRCVLAADVARVLPGCGLESLVTSFTDDVVATFAAQPIAPARTPSR